MFEHLGHHSSIIHIQQHKVRLRRKPALLLAVFYLSGFLTSCGRLDMEGYTPRGNDIASHKEIHENTGIIPGLNKPVEALEQEPGSNHVETPESAEWSEPAGTSEPADKTIDTPDHSPITEPAGTAVPAETQEPLSTPKSEPEKAAPAPPPADESPQTTQPEPEKGIVNPYVPYTYDQMIKDSQELKNLYPDIISLDAAGQSVEGRDLTLIKLGRGEKKIILCGSHHAREYITSAYLMKMTEEYSKAYHSSGSFGKYNVRDILDQICIYIVPMVNPDGVNLVINGLGSVEDQQAVAAMAMLRNTYREWKANINGVDLNRQYPAEWEKKYDEVGKPASESFKGGSFATEPEVKAMMELSGSNDFILAASFHSKGNVIYWADRRTVNLIPEAKDMAKRLSKLTKYLLMPVSEDPSIYSAGYENWFRLEFQRPAFCIELTPYNNTDVPHNDKKFDTLVWKNAKYIGLFLAEEAINNSCGL